MFPESPRLHSLSHGGPLGPHALQSHYGLQQLSPGEFRQRASSNASSIGRLSPIPAVPETDLQDSPWSPEDYQPGGYGSTNDRFNPDQLVDNIAESMKIRENGFLAPTSTSSSSVSSSNGQQQSSNSSGNSGPNNGTSNGYGLCQPPSYGSPYSIQSDFRSLGAGCGSTSSTSSAASSNRASSGGLVRSPPQQQRILNGPPDLSPAPPPYSIATLQAFKYLSYFFMDYVFLIIISFIVGIVAFSKSSFSVTSADSILGSTAAAQNINVSFGGFTRPWSLLHHHRQYGHKYKYEFLWR